MIKIINVKKYFNKNKTNEIKAIDEISIDFPNTGLVALLGPSGCGKTTLLNAIGGLDRIDSGTIQFDNVKIDRYRSKKWDQVRNDYVGYIFQNYLLVEDLTVYENIKLSLNMAGLYDSKEIDERVRYVLKAVHLEKYKNRNCLALSGGQQQRVAIARALVKKPKVIIADEPTGNLDNTNTIEIMNIIKKIAQTCLVIWVTHEKNLVDFYADRIISLKDGKIIDDQLHEGNMSIENEDEKLIYLKDLTHIETGLQGIKIDYYTDEENQSPLLSPVQLIRKNGVFYIKTNDIHQIKIIADDSQIKIINDHKKLLEKQDMSIHDFEVKEISFSSKKRLSVIRYKDCFKASLLKIFHANLAKKIFYGSFFAMAMLIAFNLASIGGAFTINEKDFIIDAKSTIEIKINDENELSSLKQFVESKKDVEFLPYSESPQITLINEEIYQTSSQPNITIPTAFDTINNYSNIKIFQNYGSLPTTNQEVVIDKWIADKFILKSKYLGLDTYHKLLNSSIYLEGYNAQIRYKIAGIVDLDSPIVLFPNNELEFQNMFDGWGYKAIENMKDQIYLVEGKLPENELECIYESSTLKVGEKINGYTIVGTFQYKPSVPQIGFNNYIGIRSVDLKNRSIQMYSKNLNIPVKLFAQDKTATLSSLQSLGFNAKDTYQSKYDEEFQKRMINQASSLVLLFIVGISLLIYIFFMMKSSMLSRIKEIGTYRALGATKHDIMKIFISELLLLTAFFSLPGYLLMSYLLQQAQSGLGNFIILYNMPPFLFIGGLAIIFTFNLLTGLIPIFSLTTKTPAQILAKYDI